jgi:hypothetical protein
MGQSAQGGEEGLWGGSEELGQERDTHLLDHLGGDGTFDAHRRIFGHGVLGGLYMRDVLAAPQLNSAQMVLMANLSVDEKSRWVRGNLSKREGVPAVARGELLTGLEPNRRSLFSKVKNLLRKAKARRTLQVLFEATAEALGEVSKEEEDTRRYFEHCGYSKSSQALSL